MRLSLPMDIAPNNKNARYFMITGIEYERLWRFACSCLWKIQSPIKYANSRLRPRVAGPIFRRMRKTSPT